MLRDTLHRWWLRLTGEMTLSGEPTLEALVKRGLTIGDHCHLGPRVSLDPPHCWHIQIGDHVTMAPEVQVLAHDASMKMHLGYTRLGKVKIGDHVFIGARSIILPNVTIGRNAIIAAGSVVSRDVPEGMVVGGVPARILCSVEEFLAKHRAQMAAWPRFDERYTLHGGVTAGMKAEMNARMGEGEAYIV